MPLIIITGLPCSGKTHRAQQIANSLTTLISSSTDSSISKRTVQIISSYHASSDPDTPDVSTNDETSLRDQIYTSASLEKTARGSEFSAIKRAISKDNIVIADGLNYIKGYRYQLWCEAKAVGTKCCVVHVAAREDECTRWNRERLRAWGREEQEDEDEEGVKKNEHGKQGENVLGDLMPESHTAIYGDRIGSTASRSRSSSVDGSASGRDEIPQSRPTDETMTLKSLYITPRTEDMSSQSTTQPAPARSTSIPSPSPPTPSLPIPLPTSAPPYSPSTLSSLCMRYEPPSPFSRWDTPLFTVPSTDTIPPLQDIWNAIYPAPAKATSKKALSQLPSEARSINGTENVNGTAVEEVAKHKEEVKRHAATVLPQVTSSDALQTLESATMDVVKHILAQARAQSLDLTSGEGGDMSFSIPLPNGEEAVDVSIHIPSGVAISQPMLQRLRRKYTQIQRGGIAHGQGYVTGRRKVIEGFVGFLEGEWDEE
ncbi:kti12, chromatin associated [Cladophialophora chaetospira]|uniref:Kti12, chromatin associated n=1 Tax=Cladophialophora chaetospira TaxID=386627 RepID=A0AA38X291_9EURO|nr:kti12, chromatin associated [Cladophialophora chaetospira]